MVPDRDTLLDDDADGVQFWFEFASPYSYIAAMRIEQLCRDAGVRLEWKPFLLGPIFELQGWETSHFNLNSRRGAYMWRDMERLTAKFGFPWRKPAVFPKPTTLAARIACALSQAPWCGEFVRRTFVANFGEDQDINDIVVMQNIITELGYDAGKIIVHALGSQSRGLLRSNTERAIDAGIFGAPNCIAGGELFWGEESLEDAVAWAGARTERRAARST